jgi:hypothetical protein
VALPDPPPREARIWVVEDLIHSDRATAEMALEQVMGFLEMRPEVEPLNCFELLCLHCVGHPLVKW